MNDNTTQSSSWTYLPAQHSMLCHAHGGTHVSTPCKHHIVNIPPMGGTALQVPDPAHGQDLHSTPGHPNTQSSSSTSSLTYDHEQLPSSCHPATQCATASAAAPLVYSIEVLAAGALPCRDSTPTTAPTTAPTAAAPAAHVEAGTPGLSSPSTTWAPAQARPQQAAAPSPQGAPAPAPPAPPTTTQPSPLPTPAGPAAPAPTTLALTPRPGSASQAQQSAVEVQQPAVEVQQPADAASLEEEEEAGLRTCRFCLEDEDPQHPDPGNPLIVPCLCMGTSRHVHRKCLEQWRHASPHAFYRCNVCGYEYQFRRLDYARYLRCRGMVPLLFAWLLLSSAYVFGFLPAAFPDIKLAGDNNFGSHLVNGLVLLGLAGFGLSVAELFSAHRALHLLNWLGSHHLRLPAGAAVAFLFLFQLLALAALGGGFVLASLFSYGLLVLAALGYNHVACCPIYRFVQTVVDKMVTRLEMSTSRMVVQPAQAPPQQAPPCRQTFTGREHARGSTDEENESLLASTAARSHQVAALPPPLPPQDAPQQPPQQAHPCGQAPTGCDHSDSSSDDGGEEGTSLLTSRHEALSSLLPQNTVQPPPDIGPLGRHTPAVCGRRVDISSASSAEESVCLLASTTGAHHPATAPLLPPPTHGIQQQQQQQPGTGPSYRQTPIGHDHSTDSSDQESVHLLASAAAGSHQAAAPLPPQP